VPKTVLNCELPGGPAAPRAARDLIRTHLGPQLSAEEAFELELLITELVTNAVRHGGMRAGHVVGLVMDVTEDTVRVEVRDRGPGFAPRVTQEARSHDLGDAGGFGLVLLDRFARDWGVELDDGARVWADIPRHAQQR
jgi:anti-sigma regulatory factor (Ser/Thr protein kinase)